jgi:hypothetical protein
MRTADYAALTEKPCSSCGEVKPIGEFYPRPGRPWRASRCRSCANRATMGSRRRGLGVTRRHYADLVVTQCGLCAICGNAETQRAARPIDELSAIRQLNVDHDHLTGKVRGLICSRCNTALGLLADDPALLRRAASYIEEYR